MLADHVSFVELLKYFRMYKMITKGGFAYIFEMCFSTYKFNILPKIEIRFLAGGFDVGISIFSFYATFSKIRNVSSDELRGMIDSLNEMIT